MTAEIRHIHPALLQMRAADSNPVCWGWRYPNADGVTVMWHSWCLRSYLENRGWRRSTRELRGIHELWIASGGSASKSGWQNAEQERMGAIWIAMYDAGAFPLPERVPDDLPALVRGPSHCRATPCCTGACGHDEGPLGVCLRRGMA